MQKIVKRSTAIRSVIFFICMCFIISIFPLNMWTETTTETVPRLTNEVMGAVTKEKAVIQTFVASYDYLGSIRIFLASGSVGDSFYFNMLSHDKTQMFDDVVMIDADNLPGYYEILVDQALEPDETYYFIIQANNEHDSLYLGAEWILRAEYPFVGQLYLQDYVMSGQSLAVDYHYLVPFAAGKVLFLIGAILLVMMICMAIVSWYYRRYPERDSLLIVGQMIKVIFNPLIIILVIAGLVAVFLETFGSYLLDNIFFAVSILMAGGICLYGVNHNRDGQAPLVTKEIIKKNGPDYFRSVLFACTIYACCEFICAQLTIEQNIAQNKQLIFFGLTMLAMLHWRQLFNMVNVIVLTIAGGYGYYYYTEEVRAGMDELSAPELTNIALETWVIIIGVMVIFNVIVNVITRLIKKEMKPVSITFGCLMLLFLSLMVVFRNTREWPILMAVCFTLFYLQYGASRKSDIVLNICRGLILSFLWMAGYSLLYRPFATFQTARYPMLFQTVTATATYLALVASASLLILLMKLRKTNKLRDVWKECILLGTVLTYLLLTTSNTGIYGYLVTAAFSLLMLTVGKGKQRIKNILTAAGLIIMSLIICFPVVFFMQRNIPALVGKPKIYRIESFHQDITRGRNPASYQYMRLGRFIETFADSFFGIPEQNFDFYGEASDYGDYVIVVGGIVFEPDEANERGLEGAPTLAERKEEIENQWDTMSDDEKEGWNIVLGIDPDQEERDFSNGRFDHFRAYYDELNAFGHETMGVLLPNGSVSYHAHNIYLQFAHDHGIYMGIFFIVIGGIAFVRSIIYYRKNIGREMYAALPLVMIVMVAVTGMVEWVFTFSNPSGFMLMLMLAPLIFGHRSDKTRPAALNHDQSRGCEET